MHVKSVVASGLVVAVSVVLLQAPASAAPLSDKDLEVIASKAMTPLPPALRVDGDVRSDVTTSADPDRGLDLCETGERAGLYALAPVAAIRSVSDVTSPAADGSVGPALTETTVDISRYATPAKAKKAWRGVLRALTERCAGATYVPGVKTTLDDGSDVIWTSVDFNEVEIHSPSNGPVGLMTTFANTLYSADDPNRLRSTQVVQQYSSWRLVGATIVRAEFAREWDPATAAPPIDPASPAVTKAMRKAVDRMALKAAKAISQR